MRLIAQIHGTQRMLAGRQINGQPSMSIGIERGARHLVAAILNGYSAHRGLPVFIRHVHIQRGARVAGNILGLKSEPGFCSAA